MSEKTEATEVAEEIPGNEAAESVETHEHEPAKQTSGGYLLFLVSLLILLLLGGSLYYLWQQQQILQSGMATLEGNVGKLSGEMDRRLQQQLEQLKQVPDHGHPVIDQRIEQNQQRLRQLQGRLQQLGTRVGQGERDWAIAEADYLLRIAEHRLTLDRDPHTARAALQAARNRLEQLDSGLFDEVLRQIDTDIGRVTAVQPPDRAALARQLAQLVATVEQLPLSATAVSPSSATPPGKGENATPLPDNSWEAIWQKLWQDLRALVTIRRQNEVERHTLAPEQRYFLRQNLQLKLESARFALLAGNAAAWQSTLEESASWLRRYFDTSDQAVIDALDTQAQLAAVELAPPLPSLSETRRLLQETALLSTPAAEPVAEEATTPSQGQSGEAPAAVDGLPAQPQGEVR